MLQAALASAKRAERAADPGRTKRQTNDALARYLALPLGSAQALRPAEGYRARSYNASKQVLGLADHLFVRYPVPLFLYRAILSPEGKALVFGTPVVSQQNEAPFRPWFLAVGRGESFAKLTRGFFTKREAHLFLLAPGANPIERNVLWARAAAAGLPRAGCDYLVERLDSALLETVGDRLPDLLRFYAEAWSEMGVYDRDEITDFVRTIARDQEFSFKGRTFGSMRRRCAEWHQTVHLGTVRQYRSWCALLPCWEFQKGALRVRAEELTNNRLLSEEGRAQRHCVLTYTDRCLSGRSAIVSLRWYAVAASESPTLLLDRLTLEISPAQRAVVQIRGRCNRGATEEEMKVIRHWAGDHGLRIAEYA